MNIQLNTDNHRLRSLTRALIVVCGAFLLAIILSPLIFSIAQKIPFLEQYGFRRVFNRIIGVFIIAALIGAWRWIGVQFRFRKLLRRKRAVKQFLTWFVIGIACIAILVVLQYFAHMRIYFLKQYASPKMAMVYTIKSFFAALGTGLAVALFEELFFRGYLLQAFLQKFSTYRAVLFTSCIFAGVHIFSMDYFLGPIKDAQIDGTSWLAGFKLVGMFFIPLSDPFVFLPGLIGLFIAGWLLAEVTVRYGTLWPAIATHAGWVFTIKFTNLIWKYAKPLPEDHGPVWFFGEKFSATGVAGWIVIGIIILSINGILLYCLYRFVVAIARFFSHKTLVRIGRFFGRMIYYIHPGRRALAIENIQNAFPEKTNEECRTIAKQSFETLGIVGCEVLSFSTVAKHLREYVDIPDYTEIQNAYDKGNGLLFFTGHFGSWEFTAQVCGVVGFDFTAVARPFRNQWIYSHVQKIRRISGIEILDKVNIAHIVADKLKSGKAVGFVGDQYAGSHGAFITFFNQPASTSKSVARIARATGAPVVAGFDHIDENGHHRLSLHPPLYAPCTDNAEQDVFSFTQTLMSILEGEIRANPGMWLWSQRKWRPKKNPPVR